jgi:hypothetical protein
MNLTYLTLGRAFRAPARIPALALSSMQPADADEKVLDLARTVDRRVWRLRVRHRTTYLIETRYRVL